MNRVMAIMASILLATAAPAHDLAVGDLQIIHPHIPQPAATAKAAGGFMTIVNSGAESDQLIGIESDIAARSEVHESKVDANGVGSMRHVEVLDIPPGGTVSLEHGGYHIMFMGLNRRLVEGEMHKAILIFERAGRVEIEFEIDPPAGQGAAQGGMGHSKMPHAMGDQD